MEDFNLGQKVWVLKPKLKNEGEKRRNGIIKYKHERFIGIWIEAFANPKDGWIESFLSQDLDNGEIIVLPQNKNVKLKIS